MAEKKQITENEHFVPRVYLKGFSNNGKSFFAYNIKDDKQINNCSIETASRQKQLYEFRNNDNKIIAVNHLEDTLAKVESLFLKHQKCLLSKANNFENLNTKCFFSSEEKAFWKTYIVIQMLRTPLVIKYLSKSVDEITNHKFAYNEIRNYTLISSLPVTKELRINNNSFFMFLLNLIVEDSICAFVDKSESLFTSDNPIACNTPMSGESEIDLLYFPVTPRVAIILFGGKNKMVFPKNSLCIFNHQQLYRFKFEIAHTAQNMIYSKKNLAQMIFI